MNSQIAIEAKNLSKDFILFNKSFDYFKFLFSSIFTTKHQLKKFNALSNISFQINKGDCVGVVGFNGAGKSTLLQLVSNIMKPSSGSISVNGRVTALLELGSGFNYDFNGIDNIFFNGEILGFKRSEIKNKLQSIIEFADLGDFIYQPLKTYSSGMVMRLAFAIQTSFEPDILIVDEALSVGDVTFQSKCIHRIKQLIDEKVTILFVSHYPEVIKSLCNKCLLLNDGQALAFGNIDDVFAKFKSLEITKRNQDTQPESKKKQVDLKGYKNMLPLDYQQGIDEFIKLASIDRSGTHKAFFNNVFVTKGAQILNSFSFNDEVVVNLIFTLKESMNNLNINFSIKTLQDFPVIFHDRRFHKDQHFSWIANNFYIAQFKINLPLQHGQYKISCSLNVPGDKSKEWLFHDVIYHALSFNMTSNDPMLGSVVSLPAEYTEQEI